MSVHQYRRWWFVLGIVLIIVGYTYFQVHDNFADTIQPAASLLVSSAGGSGEVETHESVNDTIHLAEVSSLGNSVEAETPRNSTLLNPSDPLLMRAELSHSLYGNSSPEQLLLSVDLSASSNTPSLRRPLNLALVIDQSGSMNEEKKFKFAMQAAEMVVDNLSDQDIVSITAFNATATVLSPAGRVVNKEFLHHRLGEIVPEGLTNFSAGLLEGLAQIKSQSGGERRQHVIILTDGMANRGVTAIDKLRKIVSTAHSRQISLSTFGCGHEFDEKLLTALAEAGGGRYTYIRSSEQIPTALAAELDGLLNVVAQNIKFEISAAAGTQITRVYGRLINEPVSAYTLYLGDFRDREQSLFLVELNPRLLGKGTAAGATVSLTWDNPDTSLREHKQIQVSAEYSTDETLVQQSENTGIIVYARVLESLENAEEAVQGLDIGRFRQVSEQFDELYEDARRHAIKMRDQKLLNQVFLLKHFMDELTAAQASGLMHGHQEAKRRIEKEVDYRRYLLKHHRLPVRHETRNKPPDTPISGAAKKKH